MKKDKPQNVAIFGGSFNPIHLGHLHLAQAVQEELDLSEIIFMPSGRPPHKVMQELEYKEHRYEMVRLSVESNPGFTISRLELDRDGYSYTAQTLELIRESLPGDAVVYFIIGADSLVNMHKWREPEKIFALCEVIVIDRIDIGGGEISEAINALNKTYGAKIHLLKERTYPISSTQVRKRVEEGRSVRYFVRDEVAEYIKKHDLYRKKWSLDSIKAYLEQNLSQERYAHSEGTAEAASRLAKVHGEDADNAYLAGLLHDIAKELTPLETEKYSEGVSQEEFSFAPTVHQFIGANVARSFLGIEDSDILNAIRYHTTARPLMSVLEKIIFMADKIEDGRSYPEVDYLKKLAESSLDKAVYETLKITTSITQKKGEKIHPLSLEALEAFKNN